MQKFLLQLSTFLFLAAITAGLSGCAQKDGVQTTETPKTPETVTSTTPAQIAQTHEAPTQKDSTQKTQNIETLSNADNAIDTSNWKTYTNKEYGFSAKYPEGWEVDDAPGPYTANFHASFFDNKGMGIGLNVYTRERYKNIDKIEAKMGGYDFLMVAQEKYQREINGKVIKFSSYEGGDAALFDAATLSNGRYVYEIINDEKKKDSPIIMAFIETFTLMH